MTVMAGEIWSNEPSTYGLIDYGTDKYGVLAQPSQPQPVTPQWLVEPFIAQSLNYAAVGVSWTKPTGTPARWRLLSNRYGYPVDQNDGNILLDSTDWLGTFYLDSNVIPGSYIYYGIYAQTNAGTNTWVRAGVTGCLTTEEADTADWMVGRLPAFFTRNPVQGGTPVLPWSSATSYTVGNQVAYNGLVYSAFASASGAAQAPSGTSVSNTWWVFVSPLQPGNLTQDSAGNAYLQQFLQVLGWGLDYVQGQYDMLARHLNDPMAIPIDDLVVLATQIGMPYDPMVSIFLMRKAAANWAHVTQERGTPTGFANHLSLLTGYAVDLQIGQNLMLEQDQSQFTAPSYPAWNAYTAYKLGEIVSYQGYLYSCLIAGTVGTTPPTNAPTAPPFSGSSNANWQIAQDAQDPSGVLNNAATGGVNTWEGFYPLLTNGEDGSTSLVEAIGNPGVSSLTVWQSNTLKVLNQHGSTTDLAVRSVARTTADIAVTQSSPFPPNKGQGVNDGIPVPYTIPSQAWNSTVRYRTGSIVTYNGLPYQALRASTGATPSTYTNEWVQLSPNSRLRLWVAAQVSQNLTTATNQTVHVTPFVEWYDQWGNFMLRVIARTTQTTAPWGSGTAGIPSNLTLDSFVQNPGALVTNRVFDNAYSNLWTLSTGAFTVSNYGGGVAYPTNPSTRSLALVTGPANGQIGLTFVTPGVTGAFPYVVFRYSDSNNYWIAGMSSLKKKVAGAYTTVATYSTAAQPSDRLVVQMNGNAITVLLNGVSVATASDSFNASATQFGILSE